MLFGSMAARAEKAIEPTAQLLETWFGEIVKNPVPFDSCFHAAYPETTWTHVECGVGTGKSFRNSFLAIRPQDSEKNQILSSDRVLSDNNTIQTVGGGGSTDWLVYGTNLPTDFSSGARKTAGQPAGAFSRSLSRGEVDFLRRVRHSVLR